VAVNRLTYAVLIGLTGGICCGKSTALDIFSRHGFEAVDMNQHVRDVLQGSERVKDGLRRRFGEKCVDENSGQVLMNKLSQLIFQDVAALTFLENLIYPEVATLWQQNSGIPSVVEGPQLFEKNLDANFDHTICVYASYAMQVSRAIAFRGWEVVELTSRMRQELPLSEKVQRAQYVIGNNGTLLQLERQIQQFLRQIHAL
jgi:dephospho-CoA kinase